jgi:tetratricopeptide (TPR) repeat protein
MVCPNCGATLASADSDCRRCDWTRASATRPSSAAQPDDDADLTRQHSGPASGMTPPAGITALQPGQQFSTRYTVIKLLGSGGMGEVYHAWDETLGGPVALKIIRPGIALGPSDLEALEERFKRELRLARQVTHPNVIRIHDLGEVNGLKYLTMEYVQGADLSLLLKRQGKMAVGRALSIARQVAAGLAAVHKAGIVHRDLKPANVIVDGEDHARLTDFGIARAVDAKTLYTLPGSVVGTLEYMAPEQARGDAADQRSDIYALGLILYDLLAGGRPRVKSDDALAALIDRLEHGPPPLSAIDPSIPADTVKVIEKCLAIDPAKRYQSLPDLIADLDRLTPDGRVIAQPQPVPPPVDGRRRLVLVGAATAIVLVGLGALVWRFTVGRPTAPPASHSPVTVLIADFENRANDPVFDGSLEQPLGVAMEGASFITAYPRKDATQIARRQRPDARLDEAAARLVAFSEGIPLVFAGTIAASGAGYRLTVRAVETTKGDTVTTASEEARSKSDVLQAVGRVADSMRRALGDTAPSDRLAAETFTSASLEAVKNYTIAQTLSSDFKNEEAIVYYRRAIQEDGNFGRAYAGWAGAAYDLGRIDEAKPLYDKALKLSDQMTEREKYRTRGAYFFNVAHNNQQAMDTYKALVSSYPSDFAGHNNLAVVYFSVLDFDNARAEGRRALDLYPRSLKFQGNYALYAMYAGDFKDAADMARAIHKKDRAYVPAYLPLAIEALANGDLAGAKAVYKELATLDDAQGASLSAIGLADIALFEGRPADAVAILVPAIDADRAQKNVAGAATKMMALAEAQSSLNQMPAALKSIDEALKISTDTRIVVPAVRLLLRANENIRAQSLISTLGSSLQPQARAYASMLEGERLIALGRAGAAMDALAEARKRADLWLVRFITGMAYERFDHHVEALSELELCTKRIGEATAVFLDDMPTFRYTVAAREWLKRAQQGSGSSKATASSRR